MVGISYLCDISNNFATFSSHQFSCLHCSKLLPSVTTNSGKRNSQATNKLKNSGDSSRTTSLLAGKFFGEGTYRVGLAAYADTFHHIFEYTHTVSQFDRYSNGP